MMQIKGKKNVSQGKYDVPVINQKNNEEIEYERFILNLDTELIKKIEDYIFEQKKKGIKLKDAKTGNFKRINKSLWAREVFYEALRNAEKNQ